MQKLFFKNFSHWLVTVSRGYSLPMTFFNFLVCFMFCASFENANFVFGLLCLVGLAFAHLGTNLFDDCIDFLLKVPKQKCKTQYLDTKFTDFKTILMVTFLYFSAASLIGLFFLFKCGLPVVQIALVAAFIIIVYPKLNNFALGEAAIFLCFGPLMFAGISYVMLNQISLSAVLISIPVAILTAMVGFVHSIMDYDFDKNANKKTLCIRLGEKKNSIFLLISSFVFVLFFTFYLVLIKILPVLATFVIFLFLPCLKLVKQLKKHIINKNNDDDFLKIFASARNISILYNIILDASLFF